ncbi:MAG: methylated-DNA--[protein]-cysteine S-methyltransferase [Clostridiaceae bacterium]|nr:methylated-DNA--[protein]-cysteine S-methyltransferase [Clostridiaceae bacterium]
MKNVIIIETMIGKVGIAGDEKSISDIIFNPDTDSEDFNYTETPILKEAAKQLEEYFAGKRKTFDLPLSPKGTDFQRKVWDVLTRIPYGETLSYGDVAKKIGNPKACRAVGMANNKNPIPIIIPCHRVIGSSGKLVGYGGGLHIKEKLLELEQKNL